ncbi:CarD family transcriptional regulator [Bacillota bacterium LX-D]|nr:CarD family transcriptional regulator [Bacillota bacterium LX-D]
MFTVGDKVVYPMHGAGVIEAIEEKEVLGEKRKYYVMRLPLSEMKVMIPFDNVGGTGLRQVIDEAGFQKVLKILQDPKNDMSTSWNLRYRANLEKIKGGNIYEIAEVVKNLSIRDREKGLSAGEKKMLESARQILISELVLAKDVEEPQVKNLLEGVLT